MTPGEQPAESRSSVKITCNSKGDPQWEVKVYVGDDETAIDAARQRALSQYRSLETEFFPRSGGGAS